MDNMDQMDDNIDAFNDETFGDLDTDWESEHEKLISMTAGELSANPTDNNTDLNKNNFVKSNQSFTDSRLDDNFDDIFKSISKLGLEDEDFDDPAIMTYARGTRSGPLEDSVRRLSRSSPPPPAPFLTYEEYSASPQTQSIWSTTQMDSSLNTTPTTSSVINMRTVADIENDMINRNRNQLLKLATIKRPINLEELEANLLNESPISQKANVSQSQEWSPFGPNSTKSIPNGKISAEEMLSIDAIEKRMRTEAIIKMEAQRREDDINLKAVQMMASEVIKEPQTIDPLLKAQTLAEIERQLISPQSPSQRQKLSQSAPQPQTPVHNAMRPMPNSSPMLHSPNRPLIHRPPYGSPAHYQMMARNQMNNMYNRHPVRQMMPGMVPLVPALIPNSQRIFPYGMQARPLIHPLLNPLNIQQQQHLHQQHLQQRHQFQHYNYPRHSGRYHEDSASGDEYAGLMTQREKEWLIKIQQMQTELKDPYVDDYYYVTYISRKIAAKAANDKENKTTPSLLLPERPKPTPEPEAPKYVPVQFEGSLGKIQVSNVNCPRKLLDCKLNKTNIPINDPNGDTKTVTKSEVQRFRKLLLEIEKLYVVLINIDDEDKRMAALPEEARGPNHETRRQLCDRLFRGLTNESRDKINSEVANIKKGLALVFRSLSYLTDEQQKAVIISDLLTSNNFRQYIIKPKDRLDYGLMLVNAIRSINSDEILLKIVNNINNISVILKSEVRY